MRFSCKKCGFQFESIDGKSCPYCGAKGASEPLKNADELINEVE